MHISSIKGILFDLDGVFYVGNQVVPGATEVLSWVTEKKIPHRFITNTSTQSKAELQKKLWTIGLDIASENLFTAPVAVAEYLKKYRKFQCHLVLRDNVKKDFPDVQENTDQLDAVVIGDVGDAWNYQLLNQIFHEVLNGAELIAIHKNKYWKTEAGLQLDIGAFVAGIEFATGKTATILGKPSPEFFKQAFDQWHAKPEEIIVIGDDIDADVGGAKACGMRGVLVKTGKFRQEIVAQSKIKPDAVIDSIADLPAWLNNE